MDFGTLVTSVEKLDQVFTENTVKAINRNLTARNLLTGFYIEAIFHRISETCTTDL
jgi:hypothetical protein